MIGGNKVYLGTNTRVTNQPACIIFSASRRFDFACHLLTSVGDAGDLLLFGLCNEPSRCIFKKPGATPMAMVMLQLPLVRLPHPVAERPECTWEPGVFWIGIRAELSAVRYLII